MPDDRPLPAWRNRIHEVIFEADTPAGKAFDVFLILTIIASVVVVMLDSVEPLQATHGPRLKMLEWIFTILFTIEYGLRLVSVRRPLRYARSFYGVVDLLSILPTYISYFLPGSEYLLVIRALRLLRIFRVFKLVRFISEGNELLKALSASRAKITVFLTAVTITVVIVSAVMYLLEGLTHGNPGFDSIPASLYWAIVTITTVGYGDAAPETALGKTLASILMLIGYSMIIVPTGIVSAELAQQSRGPLTTQACPTCCKEGHDRDAQWCKFCGSRL